MLVQYTHISSLSPDQKQRLRTFLSGVVLEGRAFVQFEGMTISTNEAMAMQRVIEQERRKSGRQNLFG